MELPEFKTLLKNAKIRCISDVLRGKRPKQRVGFKKLSHLNRKKDTEPFYSFFVRKLIIDLSHDCSLSEVDFFKGVYYLLKEI